jgi:Zn-dependent peptidase ImmA (M78 family)
VVNSSTLSLRSNDRIVAPRTKREIEAIAEDVRHALDLGLEDRVSMLPILEQVLYDVIEDYEFHVEDDHVMGNLEGLTDTHRPIIKLKNSVYLGLERAQNRPRFTAAHEFGHLVLHCGLPTYRAFSTEYQPLCDPERQANIFAGAFLMPRQAFLACRTVKEVMQKFGVSHDAALCRSRHLNHRLTQARPILSVVKNKGPSKRRTL